MRRPIEGQTAPQPLRTAGLAAAARREIACVVAVLGDVVVKQIVDVEERAARAADVVVVRKRHAEGAAIGARRDTGDCGR